MPVAPTSRPPAAGTHPQPPSGVVSAAGRERAGVTRRAALLGGAAGAAAVVTAIASPSLAAAATRARRASPKAGLVLPGIFTPVPPNTVDDVTVALDHRYDVVVRWGDPILGAAPAFDAWQQSPAAQARQFGFNCDYVGIIALGDGRAVMAVNNESAPEGLMFPKGVYAKAARKAIAMQAVGISVVEIERGAVAGSWRQRDPAQAPRNRRITATTPMRLTGPAAGNRRLRTTADPAGTAVRGTLANCSGGVTPWGTTLHGEENIDGYFDASAGLDPRHTDSYRRYGLTGDGAGWSVVDRRFDLSLEPQEPFRFGWVVEVDVMNPGSTPRKRTMLGRLKHEAATCSLTPSGQAVVYLGDDERGEYIYKFVSRKRFRPGGGRAARAHNLTLLDTGLLSVAVFTGDGDADGVYDGTGRWVPLASDRQSFVPGFTVADVLIDTRLAADAVGATPMDRPEDIERNPVNGKVYAVLTNNVERGTTFPVDEANPIGTSMVRPRLDQPLVSKPGNRNGFILELTEDGDDPASDAFSWGMFLVAGDPEAPETYYAGFPPDQGSPISCPDNITFDGDGNLWIATNGNALGSHDGLFAVPVDGPERGRLDQFMTMPRGAETCGPWISDDGQSVFAAVQHPGDGPGSTFDHPASTWPRTDPFPRPSVIVAYRER